MDPLSIVGAVAGSISITTAIARVLDRAISTSSRVKDAPQLAVSTLRQVTTMQATMISFQKLLDERKDDQAANVYFSLVDAQDAFLNCVTALDELETVVRPLRDRKLRSTHKGDRAAWAMTDRLAWAMKDRRINQLTQRVRDAQMSLALMLSIIQHESLIEAHNDIANLTELCKKQAPNVAHLKRRSIDSFSTTTRSRFLDDDASTLTPAHQRSESTGTIQTRPQTTAFNPRFSLEVALNASTPYRRARGGQRDSYRSSALNMRALSHLSSLSGSSIGTVSTMSSSALPIFAKDFSNPQHFPFGEMDKILEQDEPEGYDLAMPPFQPPGHPLMPGTPSTLASFPEPSLPRASTPSLIDLDASIVTTPTITTVERIASTSSTPASTASANTTSTISTPASTASTSAAATTASVEKMASTSTTPKSTSLARAASASTSLLSITTTSTAPSIASTSTTPVSLASTSTTPTSIPSASTTPTSTCSRRKPPPSIGKKIPSMERPNLSLLNCNEWELCQGRRGAPCRGAAGSYRDKYALERLRRRQFGLETSLRLFYCQGCKSSLADIVDQKRPGWKSFDVWCGSKARPGTKLSWQPCTTSYTRRLKASSPTDGFLGYQSHAEGEVKCIQCFLYCPACEAEREEARWERQKAGKEGRQVRERPGHVKDVEDDTEVLSTGPRLFSIQERLFGLWRQVFEHREEFTAADIDTIRDGVSGLWSLLGSFQKSLGAPGNFLALLEDRQWALDARSDTLFAWYGMAEESLIKSLRETMAQKLDRSDALRDTTVEKMLARTYAADNGDSTAGMGY